MKTSDERLSGKGSAGEGTGRSEMLPGRVVVGAVVGDGGHQSRLAVVVTDGADAGERAQCRLRPVGRHDQRRERPRCRRPERQTGPSADIDPGPDVDRTDQGDAAGEAVEQGPRQHARLGTIWA